MDLASAYAVVEKTAEALGKLAGLKEQLKAQPDQAAAALAGCLAEVHRTYLAVSAEITRLTVLSAPGALADGNGALDLQPLFELEGNAVRARVEHSRGHCTRIRNIYARDLDGWFERVFGTGQASSIILREVFDTLGEADTQTFVIMHAIADVVGRRARDILSEMMKPKPDPAAARALARSAYLELRPMRAALQELDIQLSSLEGEFIENSGAATHAR